MLIAGFQKTSLIDYPKKISAVIFTQGCNMNCGYCHNRHIINTDKKSSCFSDSEVLDFLLKRKLLLDGVVITGGEPTLQKDLLSFIERIKCMEYSTKLDTNGTNPDILNDLIRNGLIDYVAMDIKAPLINYSKICCSVDTGKIEKSIQILLQSKLNMSSVQHMFPDLTEKDLIEISKCISGARKYVIQQYRQVNKADGTYTG